MVFHDHAEILKVEGHSRVETSSGISASLAGRYATALFELARDRGQIESVERSLASLKQALDEVPEFKTVTTSPEFSREQAERAVLAVADQLGVTPERVSVTTGDTATTPSGGATWACRGAGIGGETALRAGRRLRDRILTLAGALVMVLADLAGRTLFAPIEIPVGIVTAVVGGPWLLWILMRPQRSRP